MKALLLILTLWAATPARATVGQTAAPTLRRPLTTRPIALSEAFTAVEGGVASMGYNPAALARLPKAELQTTFSHGIIKDNFSFLGYAHPLPFATFTGGLLFYDGGAISLNLSNGTKETRRAQQDIAILGGMSVPLPFGLAAGATVKLYRLELAGEARTSGYAADLGAHWNTPLKGLNLGAAMLNAGPDVKFEQEGDPLPLTGRIGAAYELNISDMGWMKKNSFGMSHFLFTADGVQVRTEKPALATGFEMGMSITEQSSAALRFGYLFGRDAQSLTFGIGIKEGRFLMDYALGVMKRSNNAHHVSIGVQF